MRYLRPETVEQLQYWYYENGLPPYEETRFFIGENYPDRRAFGIYHDGNEFVVYKNKDDGSRAIRYHGPDEAHAVGELFDRLLQEIGNQSAWHSTHPIDTFLFRDYRPHSLAALSEWYTLHELPPVDVTGLRVNDYDRADGTYGIRREDGVFVVYRFVNAMEETELYRGPDEDFATGELFDCLLHAMEVHPEWTGGMDLTRYKKVTPKPPVLTPKQQKAKGCLLAFQMILFIFVVGIVLSMLIVPLESCLGRNSRGSYGTYYDGGYDSSWDNDSWDSGGTDFGSDWH